MTDVSARAFGILFDVAAQHGAPAEQLLEGLPLSLRDVREGTRRLPWGAFVTFCERVEESCGGPERMADAFKAAYTSPAFRPFVEVGRQVLGPESAFYLGHRWVVPSLVRPVRSTFEKVGPQQLRLTLEIEPGYRDCPAFLRCLHGGLSATPRMLGLPDAHVELLLSPGRGRYLVHMPPSMSLRARLRRAVDAFVGGGALVQELVTHTDELNRRVDEAREARAAAEQASRMKSQMLANVSHEIRTPLNAVRGFSELLLLSELDGEAREYAEQIRVASRGLVGVLEDLLDFSKIEAGAVEIRPDDVALAPLVDEVLTLFAADARRRGVALEVALEDGVPAAIRVDPLRLRQVLTNLVSNACKFTCEGAVRVRVQREERETGAWLRFSVEDTGVGIPLEAQAHVFEPFRQVEETAARSHGGTGLGLAISKKLVERMGGELGLSSAPGVGSTLAFSLPLVEAAPGSFPRGEGRAGIAVGARLLLAEDNPISREVARRLLVKMGFVVEVAVNGAEALARAASDRFDAILMDCRMPEMDGYEATRRIRALPGEAGRVPIVAVTAHAMREDRERCLQAGMDECLVKPIEPERMHEVIARLSTRPAAS